MKLLKEAQDLLDEMDNQPDELNEISLRGIGQAIGLGGQPKQKPLKGITNDPGARGVAMTSTNRDVLAQQNAAKYLHSKKPLLQRLVTKPNMHPYGPGPEVGKDGQHTRRYELTKTGHEALDKQELASDMRQSGKLSDIGGAGDEWSPAPGTHREVSPTTAGEITNMYQTVVSPRGVDTGRKMTLDQIRAYAKTRRERREAGGSQQQKPDAEGTNPIRPNLK